MPERFHRVETDIYRGGAPSDEDLQQLADVFNVKTIISLDGDVGFAISEKVKNLGMEHKILPLGGIESKELLDYLSENICELLTENKPTYIHCLHGSDRTGLAIALYRVKCQKWPDNWALTEAKSLGFGKKIDKDTERLYTGYIVNDKTYQSTLDGDVVDLMRDWFNMGDTPPAFNPQQSFGPRAPVDTEKYIMPQERQLEWQNMREKIMEYLADDAQTPMVGQYDNWGGVRGFGPVENQGFLNI